MHEQRFTGRVEEYATYRARYPEALSLWLKAECGLSPEWSVADVGAGTGMLAEVFLAHGCDVVAVEPNAEMRAECEQLAMRYSQLRVVDGTAEQTGLPTASVEMVSVGRALHWFDAARAEMEFRRVLRPCGWVVVVSSGREHGRETEQGRAFEELLLRFGTDAKHVRGWARRPERTTEFLRAMGGGAEPLRAQFVTERQLNWEAFAGETQSLSVAPLPGSARFGEMQRALRAFFAEWSREGLLCVRTACVVGAARLAS